MPLRAYVDRASVNFEIRRAHHEFFCSHRRPSVPGHKITILNRGVSGEEVADMLARLDTAVIAEKPDLVLWQVGTNWVLRDKAVQTQASLLHQGLVRLKATGADVVLMDPQYAPRVIAKPNADGMVSLIAATAKAEHVGVFHRFDLMRHWYEEVVRWGPGSRKGDDLGSAVMSGLLTTT